jgi:hypothetical protein
MAHAIRSESALGVVTVAEICAPEMPSTSTDRGGGEARSARPNQNATV